MEKKPILVLYHGNCPDGFTAAWAVHKALGEAAEYRPCNYGEPPVPEAETRDRDVILVDFSYPRPILNGYAVQAHKVVVLDHHKTAEADLRDWKGGRVFFDMERSGAGIAWDHFHGKPRPAIVNYIEDRDLWRFKLPHSREVSEFLFSVPRTFEMWDEAAADLEQHFDTVVHTGTILLRSKQERVKAMCKHVRWLDFGGVALPVVNASVDFSDVGEYLAERLSAPAAGYYFDRADKRQWGFRSKPGFDVSELCKRYGGGGHATAAGFQSEIGWEPPRAAALPDGTDG